MGSHACKQSDVEISELSDDEDHLDSNADDLPDLATVFGLSSSRPVRKGKRITRENRTVGSAPVTH